MMLETRSPIARSCLHDWHAAHGARFIERDGWSVVAAYSQANKEAEAARTRLALADISWVTRINPSSSADLEMLRAAFWLLGPRLEDVLCRLTSLEVRPASLPGGGKLDTAFAGVEATLASPLELSVPSLQVHVSWELGEYVWEATLEAGKEIGITPIGFEALHLLGAC
jgi:glycine cleavage system aminomethyltransferase T